MRDQFNVLGGVGAAWTAWTPTIDQGVTTNIAKTVDDARYIRLGTLVIASFNLSVTGTGTAGSNVIVSLPIAATRTSTGFKYGAGGLFDNSTSTNYAFIANVVGSGFALVGDWSGTGGWGGTPSIAIANGDRIAGFLVYEVATVA